MGLQIQKKIHKSFPNRKELALALPRAKGGESETHFSPIPNKLEPIQKSIVVQDGESNPHMITPRLRSNVIR